MSHDLGFIGAGNMAEAIARAAIDSKILTANQIVACDVHEPRRALFASLGMDTVVTAAQVIATAKQIMIAVKPQQFDDVAKDLAENLSPDQVVISIMAGITSSKLAAAIAKHRKAASIKDSPVRIIRVMPNTPLQVGMGMAGISLGEEAQRGDESLALRLFGSAGKAVVIPESQIDALTAVSGSGPAYLFYLAEAMEKAADEMGLGEHGRLLVAQTLLGSAKLLAESSDTAAELRRKVTSPKGTTEAAIKHMEGNKMMDTVVDAMKAAQKRSIELGA